MQQHRFTEVNPSTKIKQEKYNFEIYYVDIGSGYLLNSREIQDAPAVSFSLQNTFSLELLDVFP